MFLVRNSSRSSLASFSWGSGAFVLVCSILLLRLLLPNIYFRLVSPLFAFGDRLSGSAHAFFAGFSAISQVQLRAEQLALDNEILMNENRILQTENDSLRSVLGTGARSSGGIIASIVARPPMSPYDTLIVAAGAEDGVMANMEAFASGGVPIGVVRTVSSRYSEVILFSAWGVTTQGWIGKDRIPVELSGGGGGTFQTSLSRAAAVAEGDSVYLPGPGQLPMGRVLRIDDDVSSPSVTLRIVPFVNFFSLGTVELRATGSTLNYGGNSSSPTP